MRVVPRDAGRAQVIERGQAVHGAVAGGQERELEPCQGGAAIGFGLRDAIHLGQKAKGGRAADQSP